MCLLGPSEEYPSWHMPLAVWTLSLDDVLFDHPHDSADVDLINDFTGSSGVTWGYSFALFTFPLLQVLNTDFDAMLLFSDIPLVLCTVRDSLMILQRSPCFLVYVVSFNLCFLFAFLGLISLDRPRWLAWMAWAALAMIILLVFCLTRGFPHFLCFCLPSHVKA